MMHPPESRQQKTPKDRPKAQEELIFVSQPAKFQQGYSQEKRPQNL